MGKAGFFILLNFPGEWLTKNKQKHKMFKVKQSICGNVCPAELFWPVLECFCLKSSKTDIGDKG
ncbi:hypothetical protein DCCM_3518 [Desulfocucumis palustris]|uniref:Uncharacterized protein n=1 Tax=Desulfocucumis palustris TaxID=1898651 RepID=A0A2L2XDV5_9FIRM|nr:hypothetical protein DCCM_3518 [Desulfocucumis palustris]